MKRILVIAALVVCMPRIAAAQNIGGDWQGTLKAGSVELRLVLHISQESNGGLKATLDSVDQEVNGISVTTVALRQSRLSFIVNSVNGSYEGTLDAKATTIRGTWSQGQPLPLDFQRATTSMKMELRNDNPSDTHRVSMGTAEAGVKLPMIFSIQFDLTAKQCA